VSYAFGNYEVLVTQAFTPTSSGSVQPEVTNVVKGNDFITIASYNVLNLDPKIEDPALTDQTDGNPTDDVDDDVANGRFKSIAAQIVNNLRLPDIIGFQEIQDNDGTEITSVTAADQTLQLLIDEVAALSGIRYVLIDNPFIGNGTSGGAPGGNIRTAFLYNPARVKVVKDSVVTITNPQDQQTNPNNPFYNSRLPLVATFRFSGKDVTVVNNHFTSKGGSSPLFGRIQPSAELQEDPTVNGGVDIRRAQAEAVKTFVDNLISTKKAINVVVLGDLNEFEFVSPLNTLEQSLLNLTETLPENERYSFIFEGNSQSLDHILVSPNLALNALFDAIHVNSEFVESSQRASDHDPLVVRLRLKK
jgi:predicted extracellular nuclease